jgi:hypothetical protein
MYVQKLVSSLVITLVMSGMFALLPQHIFAGHCGCGNCAMAVTGRCTCSIWPYWCLADDDPSLFKASINTYSPEVIPAVGRLNLISTEITEIDVTKTIMNLVSGGECLHKKVTLNLLRNAGDTLKLVPARFEEKI